MNAQTMIKHIDYRLITFDVMLIKSTKLPSRIWFYPSYELVTWLVTKSSVTWISPRRLKLLYDTKFVNYVHKFDNTRICHDKLFMANIQKNQRSIGLPCKSHWKEMQLRGILSSRFSWALLNFWINLGSLVVWPHNKNMHLK